MAGDLTFETTNHLSNAEEAWHASDNFHLGIFVLEGCKTRGNRQLLVTVDGSEIWQSSWYGSNLPFYYNGF